MHKKGNAIVIMCAMQALAILLCIVIYLLASSIYKQLTQRHLHGASEEGLEEVGDYPVQCGAITIPEARRAKLAAFFANMKSR